MHFRRTLGQFATGVTVVTYENDGAYYGATVNSFTSVSLDPPLVLVSMANGSKAGSIIHQRPFAINVLRHDHQPVALQFAGKPQDSDCVTWVEGSIAPQLEGALANFVCEPWATHQAGDHVLVLGKVVEFNSCPDDALVFYQGRFGRLSAVA
jgi:flavin reductase (DIM6/NTAB) family NADH-FMN oxidoreductase RutF